MKTGREPKACGGLGYGAPIQAAPNEIVGRVDEPRAVVEPAGRASAGANSRAVLLEGEAGVGKTTLWRAGVARSSSEGVCTLVSQPSESKTALLFAGLIDLLAPALDVPLAELPARQCDALEVALQRAPSAAGPVEPGGSSRAARPAAAAGERAPGPSAEAVRIAGCLGGGEVHRATPAENGDAG